MKRTYVLGSQVKNKQNESKPNSGVSRRELLVGPPALALTGCFGTPNYDSLDRRAIDTKQRLFLSYPASGTAAKGASAYIVFPNIAKAGFVFGGSTGKGTMFRGDNIIGHYSVNGISWGLQAGIQVFSMILFFMTPEAIAEFRASNGVELGTDIEYALPTLGGVSIGASSSTYRKPVYALIFNQGGIMVGASLKGAIYTAI